MKTVNNPSGIAACFFVGDTKVDIQAAITPGAKPFLSFPEGISAATSENGNVRPDTLSKIFWQPPKSSIMKILIIHASAGAGHQKAAEASFEENHAKIADFQAVLADSLDYTSRFYKYLYQKTTRSSLPSFLGRGECFSIGRYSALAAGRTLGPGCRIPSMPRRSSNF